MQQPVYALLYCLSLLLLDRGTALSSEISPRTVIDRAIQTDKTLRERRTAYEYDFVLKTEKLNRENKSLSLREVKARVRPSKDISYTMDITEDSDNKSDDARKQEARKMEEAQKLMTKIELEKLVDQYDYTLEGTETVLNHPAYVIRYSPKADFIVRSREEKVLHAINGRLWIDRESFAILRSEGKLGKPTAVAWFFATMREMNFEYKARFLPDGDPAPASFDFFFDVQIPFGYKRERQSSTMDNYRKSTSQ